jgi:phage N-6-adenine-methyltransferase
MVMPKQKPGRSKQDYGTPKEFLQAVKTRLHIHEFSGDLAASEDNKVAAYCITEEMDSLNPLITWNPKAGQWAWLNPPFSDITPWVRKASLEAMKGAHICMLVPASVGANWWREYVEPYAYQSYLNGRLTFVGCEDPYPKDLALLLYTPWGFTGHEIWNWKQE